MRLAMGLTVGLGIVSVCAACASAGAHGLSGADEAALYDRISGEWLLNADESTDLAQAMREAMSQAGRRGSGPPGGMRGGRGGGGRGGMRGGRGGRGGGLPGQRPDRSGRQPGMLDDLRPDSTMSLSLSGDSVSLSDGPLYDLTLPLDNEAVVFPRRGRKLEAKAKWDGTVLIVERKFEDGPRVTDRIEGADETRLVVEREVELPQGVTIDLILVYDRRESPS